MEDELDFLRLNISAGGKNPWQTVGYLVSGTLGFSLCFSVMLVLICASSFAGEPSGAVWQLVEDVLFLVGVSLSFFASYRMTDCFRSPRVAAVLSFLPVFAVTGPVASFSGQAVLHASGWLVSGLSCGMMFMLASSFLCSLSHKRLLVLVAMGVSLGILLAFVVLMLSDEGRCVAVGCLSLLAVCLMAYPNILCRKSLPFVVRGDSKQRSRVSRRSFAATVGNSLCIGFMLYCCAFVCMNPWRFLLVGAVGFVAAVIMAVDGATREFINECLQLKFTMPCVVLGFMPLVFLGDDGMLFGCMILAAVFTVQYITNLAAVCENVYLYQLSPTRSIGLWRQGNVLGMALGMFVAYLAYSLHAVDQSMASGIVIFVVLFLLAVLSSLFYQDSYPSIEPPTAKEKLASGEIESKKGRWIAKCELYAQRVGLSPREQEVAILLATGHDQEFIQNKLYISRNTVKAHTYNIYRKADVHSRKELVAAIEAFSKESSS